MYSLLTESEYQLNADQNALLEYYAFVEMIHDSILSENATDVYKMLGIAGNNMKDLSKKMGLHIGKSKGTGIIQTLIKSGINITKVFVAAFKAMKGGKDAKDNFKKALSNLKVTKGDILDFLLRLDQASLHLLTGPIHFIDAITGWHLWSNVKETTSDFTSRIKQAFYTMVQTLKELPNEVKGTVSKYVTGLKNVIDDYVTLGNTLQTVKIY
jgi:hypothetical protein